MVKASKVLGVGKRGWFCVGCAENGGFPAPITQPEPGRDLGALLFASLVIDKHGKTHDWMGCKEHANCRELLAYCEADHQRYGEILFPRERGKGY
jgi:hypothetical protein